MAYGNYNYAPFYRNGYYNSPMLGAQNAPMPNMTDNQNQFAQNYQSYQNYQNQPQNQSIQGTNAVQNQVQNPMSNDIIWVQGEAGAKAYLVAPNNTVTLWDSESSTIYVKSADMNGVPSMRVLDFTERAANAPQTPSEHICKCGDKFIPKDELKAINGKFNDIFGKLEDLEEKYKTISAKSVTKTTKTIKTEE